MDQPGNEMMYLATILDAFSRYEDYRQKKDDTRSRNRARATEGAE